MAKVRNDSHTTVTARLPAEPGAVARAIAGARRFAESTALPEAEADRLAVIVEEWVTNIVEHGNPAPDSRIVLRLDQAGGRVRAAFSDAGAAFDPQVAPDDGPNLERGGGAGIALIRGWSVIESYERRGGRNRLVLRLKS